MIQTTQEWFRPDERMPAFYKETIIQTKIDGWKKVELVEDVESEDRDQCFEEIETDDELTEKKRWGVSEVSFWSYPVIPKEEGK